jgi:hypothetical protein
MTTEFDMLGHIMDYESGELDLNGTIELFSRLIKTGLAWSLQGSYGRAASDLIGQGFIGETGDVNWDMIETAVANYS